MWIIMPCIKSLVMYVKKKRNLFSLFKHVIFWWFLSIFIWVSFILCYPDPDPGGQNDTDRTRSGSTSLFRFFIYITYTCSLYQSFYIGWIHNLFCHLHPEWAETYKHFIFLRTDFTLLIIESEFVWYLPKKN